MSTVDILVNKQHLLDAGYKPADLVKADIPFFAGPEDPKRLLRREAALAAQRLFCRGKELGLDLYGISGYRSYYRQQELAANKSPYVAPPGGSEHQTGLALDVSCPAVSLDLIEEFALTPEAKFLKDYGPMYGFILRYPKNKEQITGYAYEPWHIRYVSKSLALYLALTGLTLEEYHEI